MKSKNWICRKLARQGTTRKGQEPTGGEEGTSKSSLLAAYGRVKESTKALLKDVKDRRCERQSLQLLDNQCRARGWGATGHRRKPQS